MEQFVEGKINFQGDVGIVRAEIPKDALVSVITEPSVIVTHSESGHHHTLKNVGVQFFTTQDPLTCYLRLEAPTALEHQRSFDTHESIMIPAGDFMIRRQREHSPEGWRRVED